MPVTVTRPGLVPTRIAKGRGTAAHAIAHAIGAFARDHQPALIVVGSRGRSAVQEIVLGSVAMATFHRAHRAVLVVPSTRRQLDQPPA